MYMYDNLEVRDFFSSFYRNGIHIHVKPRKDKRKTTAYLEIGLVSLTHIRGVRRNVYRSIST